MVSKGDPKASLSASRRPESRMRGIAAMFAVIGVALTAVLVAPARDGKRWWSFVAMLANDDMQGRDTGSVGHRKAAELVAAEFERAGIVPSAPGGYIQSVKLSGRKIVEAQSGLELVRNGNAERLTL